MSSELPRMGDRLQSVHLRYYFATWQIHEGAKMLKSIRWIFLSLAFCWVSATHATAVNLSEAEFRAIANSTAVAASGGFQVGDSLRLDFPYYSTGTPELLLGQTTAQFDWPASWMQSSFNLTFNSGNRQLFFSLMSSDTNSRPSSSSLSLQHVGEFNTLFVGGTAARAAMYIWPFYINGTTLPNLTPNAYSSIANFDGFSFTGQELSGDFSLRGLVYFDGGTQTGDSNKFEFALAQVNAVPEPETYTLILAGVGSIAFARRRRVLRAQA